jgi:hypothetical protein
MVLSVCMTPVGGSHGNPYPTARIHWRAGWRDFLLQKSKNGGRRKGATLPEDGEG